jgi:di/tricarboxylate transporter
MRTLKLAAVLVLSVAMMLGVWMTPDARAEEKPRYGGIMRVAIEGDPPSLDMHQETTFMVKIPMSNCVTVQVISRGQGLYYHWI